MDLYKLLTYFTTPKFKLANYGIFQHGKYFFYEDYDNSHINELIRPLSKEELLAQQLRKDRVVVKAKRLIFSVKSRLQKEYVFDVVSKINKWYPNEIFELKYDLSDTNYGTIDFIFQDDESKSEFRRDLEMTIHKLELLA